MVIFRCQRQGVWTMDPEDDKKQKRIGSKARLVSRKMLKTEDEDEEQSWGKWPGTVKTAAKAPKDRDPVARSSRQDRKGDAQEPEVACKTASRCRQDRKDNAQKPEVAGKTAILGWPPAASVCASASGSGSLSVPEPVEKPRLLRVCKLVRGTLPPTSGFRARCKDKGRSFAKAVLRGPMQRQRFLQRLQWQSLQPWHRVAKAVAKVAVAKPAAAAPYTLERAMQEGGPVFPLLGNAGDLTGIRAGGYDKCTPLSAKTTKEMSHADAILRNDHRRIQLVSASRNRSPKLLPKPPASCPPLHLRIEYLVSRLASGMTVDDCGHDEMLVYQTIVDEIGEKKVKDCSQDELIIYKNLAS